MQNITELYTDDVLPSHHRSPTQRLVDGRDLVHRSSNQGGPGVSDGLTAGLTETVSTHGEAVHLELPVSLPGDGHVGEVSRVVVGVASSQQNLSARLGIGVSVEVETEDWALKEDNSESDTEQY